MTAAIALESPEARELALRFDGTAGEYFRIWVVNLCLTLLSIGVFSAWAKVRKKRYFYSRTTLDGTPFQYLAQPVPILKGRVIAVFLVMLYYAASHFFTSLLPYVLALGVILAPWAVMRSAAFNARYTAYRNMTFGFDAGYRDALRAIYGWQGAVALVLVVIAFATAADAEAKQAMLFGAVALVFGLTFPWWLRRYKHFLVSRSVFGGRYVALPDGGQFECADSAALDRLPQEGRSEGVVAWLEQRLAVAVVAVVVIVVAGLGGYLYGLPAAAERLAQRIPVQTEQALGDQALAWLDGRGRFQRTQLDAGLQDQIRQGFATLHSGLPLAAHYRLEFRNAPELGANAFALPGGAIVITDQMVARAQSLDEVLAHEIGHVESRHAMRHVLQDSAVAVAVSAATSDAASLGVAVSGLPVVLAQAKYSREFEAEADAFGFRLLRQHNLSPNAFADLMERLQGPGQDYAQAYAFVSSHPVTAERVRRARSAAQ